MSTPERLLSLLKRLCERSDAIQPPVMPHRGAGLPRRYAARKSGYWMDEERYAAAAFTLTGTPSITWSRNSDSP